MLDYDFRTKFGTSLRSVLDEDEAEAIRLINMLRGMPDSYLFARLMDWDHPVTHEMMLLNGLYSAWVGKAHPVMPDFTPKVTEADKRMAELALDAQRLGHIAMKEQTHG